MEASLGSNRLALALIIGERRRRKAEPKSREPKQKSREVPASRLVAGSEANCEKSNSSSLSSQYVFHSTGGWPTAT